MSRLKDIQFRLEYAGLLTLLALFRLFGLDRASAIGGFLFRTVGPLVPVSNIARDNMKRAMPELDRSARERILRGMWDNLGRNVVEYAYFDVLASPDELDRIELIGTENVVHNEDGSPASMVLVSGHFANFELMPLAARRFGIDCGEVYRHANNPYVNDWMINLRATYITPLQLPKGRAGSKGILNLLREQKSVAMLVDQKMNNGIEATFFGLKAMTPAATGVFAIRYGVAILPSVLWRTKGSRFSLQVYPPIWADPSAGNAEETLRLTQAINDFLEARIRERPEQWFWLHRRWTQDERKIARNKRRKARRLKREAKLAAREARKSGT